jgi:hypothetical protein
MAIPKTIPRDLGLGDPDLDDGKMSLALDWATAGALAYLWDVLNDPTVDHALRIRAAAAIMGSRYPGEVYEDG